MPGRTSSKTIGSKPALPNQNNKILTKMKNNIWIINLSLPLHHLTLTYSKKQ